MSFSIAGKTAIVTGAASGVGLAIARHFLTCGAQVVAADPDEARLTEALGREAEDAAHLRLFACDPTRKLSVANLLSASCDAFERIDILVNAYRKIELSDPVRDDETVLDAMLQHNLMAGFRLSQAVARKMIAQAEKADDNDAPAGTIIMLSTIAAQRSRPELLAYAVATAALDQATRSLALAYAPHRIRVNAVAFGSVMSSHLQAALKDHADWRGPLTLATPLGRIASASELTGAVQFLASEASGFITGQILTVDGGRGLLDPVAIPAH